MANMITQNDPNNNSDVGVHKMVYTPKDIMVMLNLSRTTAYKFLNDVFEKQSPFKVIKLNTVIRVPKEEFDIWLKLVS